MSSSTPSSTPSPAPTPVILSPPSAAAASSALATASASPHATEIERNTNPITLTRFINAERQQYFRESTGSFALLLQSIQLACKVIGNATRKAGIANLYGVSGTTNTSGDTQKKLDVFANDVMINCIAFSDQVFAMCSEEVDELIIVDRQDGGYAVVFDPLDGSSNIDCNLSVGTIFGIYKKRPTPPSSPSPPTSLKDILRPGNELLAAGYASYDAATIMAITTGNGVNMFTLDPSLGEFILTHRNVRIPKRGKVYSINEGNANTWDAPTKRYIQSLKDRGNVSSRYVGSMVGDVHRTLLYGGIFCYPADRKNPKGKLRLLYECNPISFLIEQAGGRSTTGTQRIMDLQPTELHERSPIFCGSPEDVAEVEALYREEAADPLKQQPSSRL